MKSILGKLTVIICVILIIVVQAADEKDSSLLFKVDFDDYSVNAGFAKGDPKCYSFKNPDLQLRMFPGIKSKGNALSLANDEACQYKMKGNFTPAQGTVSLWVAPQNWKMTNKKFESFFRARQKGFNMQIYKYLWGEFLFFYIRYDNAPGKKKAYTAKIKLDPSNWPIGKWHKLDCTWNRNGMKLYCDGILRPESRPVTITEVKFPQAIDFPVAGKDGKIYLGFPKGSRKGKYYVSEHKTAFDDVQVFNRSFSAAEIKKSYEKDFPSDFGKKRNEQVLTIPNSSNTIHLDGKINNKEWADASVIPVFEFLKGDIKNLKAKVYIKYSSDKIYIGFKTNQTVGRLKKHNKHDGKIWEDDSFELLLQSPQKSVYHFIVNSAGQVYDEKNSIKSWNTSPEAVAVSSATGWSVEMIIPLKDMGGIKVFKNKEWRGNFCATYYKGSFTTHSAWSKPHGGGYNSPVGFGKLIFSEDNVAVRLNSLGDIYNGQLDLNAALYSEKKLKGYTITANYQAEGSNKVKFPEQISDIIWKTRLPSGKQFLNVTAKKNNNTIFFFEKYYYVNMPLELSYKCWPSKKYIAVDLDLNNAGSKVINAIKQGEISGTVTLLGKTGKTYSSTIFTPRKTSTSVKLKLPMNLKPSLYSIKATISGSGSEIIRSKAFKVPNMIPFREKIAADHSIPPPWVSVKKVGQKAFSILNRIYKFDNSPFPVSIINHGKEMLQKAPTVVIDGKAVVWSNLKINEQYADYVCLSGKGQVNKLSFTWKGELWFDGLYKLNLDMTPAGKVNISSMKLNWAVPKQYAEFLLKPLYEPWKNNKINIEFNPKGTRIGTHFAWLTGHKLGFMWFPVSKANWVNKKNEKQIIITRAGDSATVNINIISKPVILSKTAHYTMAFMATPAKPRPENFRNFNFAGWGKAKGQTAQPIGWGTFYNKFYRTDTTSVASIIPRDPKGYKEVLSRWNKKNIKALTYGMPIQIADFEPEYDYFINEWKMIPGHQHKITKAGVKYSMHPCCGNTEVTDLFTWRINKFLNDYPNSGGIYHDVCGVKFCENIVHGHGGKDAFGQVFGTSTAFGLRDYLMRAYKVLKKKNKLLVNHAHSYFNPVCHTFSDYWYPGEQYFRTIAKNYKYAYCEEIPLGVYQSELNGKIKGVGISFLPQYARTAKNINSLKHLIKDFRTNPEWAIRTITPMLLHDVNVSAESIDRKVTVPKLWKIKGDANLKDADFQGYWTNPGVKSSSPKLLVSIYNWKKPSPYKKVLVVANMGRTEQPAALKVDWKKLGVSSSSKLYELWLNKSLTKNDLQNFELKGNHFMLIGIK